MKRSRMYSQNSIRKHLISLMDAVFNKLNPDRRPFIPLAQAEINQRKENTRGNWKKDHVVSKSTRINEQTILNHIVKCKGDEIRCCDINPKFIQDINDYLENLKISDNTKATYMSSARSLFNRMGYNGELLFDGINTRNCKTEKRAINEDEVQKLHALIQQLLPSGFMFIALLLFLFCLSANGMPFIDLAFLKWDMINNGTIVYYRRKTGVRVEVPINDFMKCVMDKISCRESIYVFGLLKAHNPTQAMAEYHNLLGRYNKALHKLGCQAGLPVKLTSYVARHSWATISYLRNYPIAFISKALGHTNILTTEKYIHSICNKELIRYSKEVAKIINLGINLDNHSQKEAI